MLWLAARDPRVARLPRLVAAATVAYALSPIDLIPDVIPVLGLLDDAVLIPAGLWLALRLIPGSLRDELWQESLRLGPLRPSVAASMTIIAIWIGTAIATGFWLSTI